MIVAYQHIHIHDYLEAIKQCLISAFPKNNHYTNVRHDNTNYLSKLPYKHLVTRDSHGQ